MKLLKGFAVAFAMYSKVPMPRVKWDKDSMAYAMCFFPLVGVLCGAVLVFWVKIAGALTLNFLLAAVGCVLLPLLVTGGIHLDGFCDTVDALSSHAEKEKKLEILSDPHIGAFGVMGCVALLLLSTALWAEFIMTTAGYDSVLYIAALGFVLSRVLSGLAVVGLKAAKKTGTLVSFAGTTQNTSVRVVLIAFMCVVSTLMMSLNYTVGACAVLTAGVVFFIYYGVSYKYFGGVTGDLAGWFLTVCEVSMLAVITLVGRFVL